MSFDFVIDELFDDAARDLNTILIVNRVNRNVKVNGMKNSCNMFINSIHWPGEIHL